MTIVAVFNQKGGVGKTTTVLNLAAALARRGRQPVGVDLDPQAQFSAITGITAHSGDDSIYSLFQRNRPLRELMRESASGISGISVIPSHVELSKVDALHGKGYNAINKLNATLLMETSWGKDRPLIIDCSPLVGVLSLNAIFACDGVIIPISADYLSMNGAIKIRNTLHALEQVLKRRVHRRYLITRFDTRRSMAKIILNNAQAEFGADVCQTVIAENVSLAESPALNKNIFEHAPDSRGTQDYNALLDELLADGFIK